MKCRRRSFNKSFRAPTEFYWDRNTQRIVSVGWGKPSGRRALKRHSAYAIERSLVERDRGTDNRVDRLIQMEHDYESQAERVGDKFRILRDEQEA